MPVSKKTRFEVFKRDGFQCMYCGQTPPIVILELDHIDPVSLGGSDEVHNLITACFDCNRGKKNIPLGQIVSRPDLEVLKEREEQLRAYNKFLNRVELRIQKDMESVGSIYTARFPKWRLSEDFNNRSLRTFLNRLPVLIVREAMTIACARGLDKDRTINYFCGICWRRINQDAE